MYNYQILNYDLSIARNLLKQEFAFQVLRVKDIFDTTTGESDLTRSVGLTIDDPSSDVIDCFKGDGFSAGGDGALKFYLTNTTIANRTLQLFVSAPKTNFDIVLNNSLAAIGSVSSVTNPITVIQPDAANLLATVSQANPANLLATVSQANPANLLATVSQASPAALRMYAKIQPCETGDFGQVNVGATATSIIAGNGNRTGISILNNNPIGGDVLYIGFLNIVTAANGYPLNPTESLSIPGGAAIWGIASGTLVDCRYINGRYS